MKTLSRGRRTRSFAVATCLLYASLFGSTADAQQLPPITGTEKILQVNEPPYVRSTLRWGQAVAVSGNTLLSVGGSSLYVFTRNASGDWAQSTKIIAYDQGALTGPIAFDGTHALIRGYTPQEESVVYHYIHDGARWRAQGALRGAPNFGVAIAMEGCTALISSSLDLEGLGPWPPRPQFVHYFDRCRTGRWTWINSISAPDDSGDHWGTSLAVSGNDAFVAGPKAMAFKGAVYHYTKTGDTWRLAQTITQLPTEPDVGFGATVAYRDSLLLVAVDYVGGTGRVLRFGRSGGQWVQLGHIEVDAYEPMEAVGYGDFGRRIVITPTHVIVGAPGLEGWRPSVWVYSRSGPTDVVYPGERIISIDHSIPWNPQDKFTTFIRTQFGEAIAAAGSTLVVGAPAHSPREKPLLVQGRTAVYDLMP